VNIWKLINKNIVLILVLWVL